MTAPTPASPARLDAGDSTHLPALDGVRGIAILLVMQFHFWAMPFRIFRRPPTLALDTRINQAFEFGWTGVDLFFVLSGFLITGILLRAKGGGSYFRAFYGRRVLRIFPLYWGYLAFVILITPLLGGALEEQAHAGNVRDHWYWYFGYAVNIWSSVKQAHPDLAAVNLHFWSLAFEEQFYLVWPVIVFLLSRQRLARVCLGLLITTALFRVYLVSPLAEGWAKPNASQVLLPRSDRAARVLGAGGRRCRGRRPAGARRGARRPVARRPRGGGVRLHADRRPRRRPGADGDRCTTRVGDGAPADERAPAVLRTLLVRDVRVPPAGRLYAGSHARRRFSAHRRRLTGLRQRAVCDGRNGDHGRGGVAQLVPLGAALPAAEALLPVPSRDKPWSRSPRCRTCRVRTGWNEFARQPYMMSVRRFEPSILSAIAIAALSVRIAAARLAMPSRLRVVALV
jgi:hypothetical protein